MRVSRQPAIVTELASRTSQPPAVRELTQLPFWCALFFWSLLPDTWTPRLNIVDLPVDSKDLLLLGVALFYGVLRMYRKKRREREERTPLLSIFFVLLYAVVSIAWSGMDGTNALAMSYTLLLAGAAVTVGYAVLPLDVKDREAFLSRLVLFLSSVSLLYFAESFFSLGLRSEAGLGYLDFGMQRVKGPLFGASTGHFILLPALGYALDIAIRQRRKLMPIAAAFGLLLAMLGLGSRSAMLSLMACLVLLLLFGNRSIRIAAVGLLVLTAIAAALILFRADEARLTKIDEEGRESTYWATWNKISSGSPASMVLGAGYGGLWPWYLNDMTPTAFTDINLYMPATDYGRMLYHPHSTIVFLVAELGSAGVFFIAVLFRTVANVMRKTARQAILGSALAASCIALLFDLFIFKNARMSVIWWMFVFSAVRATSVQYLSRTRVQS